MNRNIIFEEEGYVTLEAAAVIAITILVAVASILIVYARISIFNLESGMNKASQELSLYAVAADKGASLANLSSRIGNNSDYKFAEKFIIEAVRIGGLRAGSGIGAKKSNYWFEKSSVKKIFTMLIPSRKYRLEFNTPGIAWLNCEYAIPLYFAEWNGHIHVPVPLWQGIRKAETESSGSGKNKGDDDNFWSWHNFKRGNFLREKYGANLPHHYPVISSYNSGKAVSIKSIDTTAPYYKNIENLESKIRANIDRLSDYGSSNSDNSDNKDFNNKLPGKIISRELIVILPTNTPDKSRRIIEDLKHYSSSKGVIFTPEYLEQSYRFQKHEKSP